MIVFVIFICMIIASIILFSDRAQEDKENGTLFRGDGEYLGGFGDTEGGKSFTCLIDKNYLHFKGKLSTSIKVKDIKKVEIKSDTQIQNEITLGRIVAFGVFALGMKKKKTIIENYSVINTLYDNEERVIILKMQNNEKFVRQVKELI